ncbi:methyltransferase domain-containing protein [Bacillus sp. JCM 19041]|uniref:methyltransferase domain-containing protein n=1 Tax=Bacillus sp. JCM 19041 TaxID=1460637 RepID=UPI0006D29480
MSNYGNQLFLGTGSYYSEYRPLYPASVIRFLIHSFAENGKGVMLDLGCGTGQLACRFADWFDQIIGIDPELEMLQEAQNHSSELRLTNTEWIHGTLDTYLKTNNQGSLKLVTIAKAFHWMDRETTLEQLYPHIVAGGGIAIIDQYGQLTEPWQQTVQDVMEQWYGKERRAGNTTYTHPTTRHEEVIQSSPFSFDQVELPFYSYIWTPETIIGHLYSTSYGAKRFLGNRAQEFEQHLTTKLLKLNQEGQFTERIGIAIKMALK